LRRRSSNQFYIAVLYQLTERPHVSLLQNIAVRSDKRSALRVTATSMRGQTYQEIFRSFHRFSWVCDSAF
jgi:hypothetical protein